MRVIATCAALACLGALAPAASAAEISRAEYKAQVEPICQANTKANERILGGVRNLVREGKLKPAAAKFSKAGAALKQTHSQLRAVPQPSADEAKLAKWLDYVKTEADLFNKVAQKLRAGQKGAAQSLVNKLTTNANQANSTVLAFGFRYCRFEPAKFT
jgi:hypothetical protein